ncbi:MAG TPA: hypothetical protein VGN08_10730 [Solirubrobacteraceae bacterium]|jgi:hypothetical protein
MIAVLIIACWSAALIFAAALCAAARLGDGQDDRRHADGPMREPARATGLAARTAVSASGLEEPSGRLVAERSAAA